MNKMPKVKAKFIKRKVAEPGNDMQEFMSSLFSESSRSMDIESIKIKYLAYKEKNEEIVKHLTIVNDLIRDFEPACTIILRAFDDGYNKFFKFTNEEPESEEEIDAFYSNYDSFKTSNLSIYATRIAGKIRNSGFNLKWSKLPEMAVLGLVSLDVFNKVINDVDAPYDLSKYYHMNTTIPASKLKENQTRLTSSLKQLYKNGKEIYGLMSKPDIPVKKMFESLRSTIVKQRKEVRGVNKLFDRIEAGGRIFEENFMKYYKEMMISGNPISLYTSFLADITQDSQNMCNASMVKESAILMRHLRKILSSNVPPQFAGQVNKAKGVLDSVTKFIEENQDLGETDAMDEDDIKKMIGELESKFGISS